MGNSNSSSYLENIIESNKEMTKVNQSLSKYIKNSIESNDCQQLLKSKETNSKSNLKLFIKTEKVLSISLELLNNVFKNIKTANISSISIQIIIPSLFFDSNNDFKFFESLYTYITQNKFNENEFKIEKSILKILKKYNENNKLIQTSIYTCNNSINSENLSSKNICKSYFNLMEMNNKLSNSQILNKNSTNNLKKKDFYQKKCSTLIKKHGSLNSSLTSNSKFNYNRYHSKDQLNDNFLMSPVNKSPNTKTLENEPCKNAESFINKNKDIKSIRPNSSLMNKFRNFKTDKKHYFRRITEMFEEEKFEFEKSKLIKFNEDLKVKPKNKNVHFKKSTSKTKSTKIINSKSINVKGLNVMDHKIYSTNPDIKSLNTVKKNKNVKNSSNFGKDLQIKGRNPKITQNLSKHINNNSNDLKLNTANKNKFLLKKLETFTHAKKKDITITQNLKKKYKSEKQNDSKKYFFSIDLRKIIKKDEEDDDPFKFFFNDEGVNIEKDNKEEDDQKKKTPIKKSSIQFTPKPNQIKIETRIKDKDVKRYNYCLI